MLHRPTLLIALALLTAACGEGTLDGNTADVGAEATDAWLDDAGWPTADSDVDSDAWLGPDRDAEASDRDAIVTHPESDAEIAPPPTDGSPTPDAAPPPPPPVDAAPPPPPPPGPPEDCVRVRVANTGGIGLNVRPDPSTGGAPLGNLPDGTVVEVVAIVQGESIDGNTTWYEVRSGDLHGFVAGTWAVCMGPVIPGQRDDVFLLPFSCGTTLQVTQGNNSAFSHNGRSAFAFDFSMGIGTPMLAMKPGTVVFTYAGTVPGDPCYDGGGQECINAANYVVVAHDDGTQTQYAHLSEVHVGVGQGVAQGEQVGASGSTGWSTGPHAHIERQDQCGRAWCQSIAMSFADVEGDGVPVEGQRVTSQNGCQ